MEILHSLKINLIIIYYILGNMSLFGPKGPTYTFKLGGLTCSMCVNKVTKTVKAINGVKKAKVSIDMKKLTVSANSPINPDEIVTAIIEKGYEAEKSF